MLPLDAQDPVSATGVTIEELDSMSPLARLAAYIECAEVARRQGRTDVLASTDTAAAAAAAELGFK